MSDPGLAISRMPVCGMITLRVDPGEPRLADALAAATGCALPAPRRIIAQGLRAVAWMAPDEFLLLLPPQKVGETRAGLEAALTGLHHLAVDVTDARVMFRVAGPGAREVIAKGAPVDLAPCAFGPGDFRRTRLGQVAIAVWMPDHAAIELMCFRSVADFVGDWLANAARPGSLPGAFPTA